MNQTHISRRVFIGSTMCMVSAQLLATELSENLELRKVIKDGQFFTADELTILADVAELMIPRTATPGATDAQVAPVIDGMMVSWAGDGTKKQFRNCVHQINDLARSSYASSYEVLPFAKRQTLIQQLDKTAFENKATEHSANYRRLKEIVFHVFYSSKEANPDYRLIPGGYRGCLSKEELDEINTRGYL